MSDNDENEVFMRELREKFVQTVKENLTQLELYLKDNKFKDIATIAHDLKGTSGLFGLNEGALIAKQLQESAQKEEKEKTKTLIDTLTAYMKEKDILKSG